MTRWSFLGFAATLVAAGFPVVATVPPAREAMPSDTTVSVIDRVWSGHSVRFALAVTPERIVVGYYDAERRLTVASRPRRAGSGTWTYRRLDSRVGWDSHNYVALALDGAGQVHVAANMHGDPLVYYRTTRAGDVATLRREPVMVDPARERRMTYPVFLRDAAGRLVFKYRDGASGDGSEIYDVYDAAARRWSPLLDTPLADGEGRRNAYFMGPTPGPDGRFHLAWVWRETPAAETNHDLSYASSRDLVHWQASDGRPLALPIRLSTAEIVDPVPAGGGIINNNTLVGFDPAGRAVIAYHKFDAAGDTQVYVARREAAGWRIAQASAWRGFRWDFRGGGSLDSRVVVQAPAPAGSDRLRIPVTRDGVATELLLDMGSLRRIAERPVRTLAARIAAEAPPPAGMAVQTVEDPGGSGIAIAWATLPPHRDRPVAAIPAPTELRLIEPR